MKYNLQNWIEHNSRIILYKYKFTLFVKVNLLSESTSSCSQLHFVRKHTDVWLLHNSLSETIAFVEWKLAPEWTKVWSYCVVWGLIWPDLIKYWSGQAQVQMRSDDNGPWYFPICHNEWLPWFWSHFLPSAQGNQETFNRKLSLEDFVLNPNWEA